jgi:uncharacterized protein (DUF362 family)
MKDRRTIGLRPSATIVIKPNICFVRGYETGATVDPFIVRCLVDWLTVNYHPAEIIVGEADATSLDVDIAFKMLGWEEALSKHPNVRLLNLSKDAQIEVELDGLFFKKMSMSKSYLESDFLISVSKLKTHSMTRISCNLKNIYGANPTKYKAIFHRHLDKAICDINSVKLPDLCVVDGLIAMEGDGPISGIPNPLGLLIVGDDPVATDHACARIMGVSPRSVSHVMLAKRQNLGSTEYETFGERIDDVRSKFEFVPVWKRLVRAAYERFLA